MRVLVCDDERLQQQVLSALLKKLGIQFRVVGCGEEAVAAVVAEDFDLVLMDRVLPGIDGLEATRQIKRLLQQQEKWIPVVLLTSLSQDSDVAHGFAAGADDYLTKPINFALLQAKLRVFIRLSQQARLLRERGEVLAQYHDQAEREKRFATHVLAAMTRRAELDDRDLFVWQRAASQLSGDVVAFHKGPTGRYLMLADAMGHGLSAAFATVIAADLFYAMTAKGLPVHDIAVELNAKLAKLIPPGYLVSGVLVQADAHDVHIINAGMPAVRMHRNGQCFHEAASLDPPFGIEREGWIGAGEVVPYHRGDQLIAMSDGLTEACADLGERFARAQELRAMLEMQFPRERHLADDATAVVLTL